MRNIEVDGVHHNLQHRQALADLKRTYHSFLKGYFTLRIPNTLIHWSIDETADYIVDFLNESNYRNWSRWQLITSSSQDHT
jgi:very-short-patch-repair endonuclease